MVKPLFLVIIGIIAFLIYLKYHSILVQQETIELNNKYYSVSEKSRSIKKHYPEVENISNLTNFYNLQTIISIKLPTPFDSLRKLFSLSNPNIKIINVNWYVEDANFTDKKTLMSVDILYVSNKKDSNDVKQVLQDYVTSLRSVFQDYYINYSIEYNNTTELLTTLTIPVKLTVSNKIEGL